MIDAGDALARSRKNPHDRWVGGPNPANERIAARIVVPEGHHSFTCNGQERFFAIGSCFARNVEERLELAGADVLSRKVSVDLLGAKMARITGLFNKYTPVSILQELRWAAGETPYPESAPIEVGPGVFYDPHLRLESGRASKDAILARRAQVDAYFRQAFEADVVVITLGLIEAWQDVESGLFTNEVPAPTALKRTPERFRFKRLSAAECEAAVEESLKILRRHGKPNLRVVLTVSPVPLGRTFTQDDVIVANALSKSTLRVVAGTICDRHKDVDYFPSFEAVTLSDPAIAWQSDRLHVSDFIVGRVIGAFLERYGFANVHGGPEQTAPELVGQSQEAATIRQLVREVERYKTQLIIAESEAYRAGEPDRA